MNEKQRVVKNRLRVLEHAKKIGNVRKTCRYFGIPQVELLSLEDSL